MKFGVIFRPQYPCLNLSICDLSLPTTSPTKSERMMTFAYDKKNVIVSLAKRNSAQFSKKSFLMGRCNVCKIKNVSKILMSLGQVMPTRSHLGL